MNHLPHNVTPMSVEQSSLDYLARANMHRPTDPAAIAGAVLELAAQELTLGDIASALRLSIPAVVSLLVASPGGAAVKMLEPLKEESRRRQLAHLKQGDDSPVPAPVQEREKGEAAAKAAAIVGVGAKPPQQTKCARTGIPAQFCTCSDPPPGVAMIGGKLDARALALLAQLHRPTGEDGLRDAARELARQGLTERDIAQALKVGPDVVRRLVAASDSEAAETHADVWSAP